MRLVSRVRSAFSVDLPLVTLFASPGLAELAEQIEVLQALGRVTDLPSIVPVPRDGPLPATFGQEAWWFHWQLSPQAIRPILPAALRLSGRLDVEKLRATINEVVRRHESLRTTFAMNDNGQLVQVIAPQLLIDLPVDDLGHLPESERERQVAWLAGQQLLEPFDLARGPLCRGSVAPLGGDGARALGYGASHRFRRLVAGSADGRGGRRLTPRCRPDNRPRWPSCPFSLPTTPLGRAASNLQGETLESLLNYSAHRRSLTEWWSWNCRRTIRGRRAGIPAYPFSPFRVSPGQCAVGPPVPSGSGDHFHGDAGRVPALLRQYAGSDDVTVASTAVNRRLQETQGIIGCFVNSVLFRGDLSGGPSFHELVARVRQTTIEALDHQELPFERLVAELRPRVDVSKHPFTRVLYNFLQPTTNEEFAAQQELSVEYLPVGGGPEESIFDLTLMLTDDGEGLRGLFRFDTSQFDPSTIARMADDLRSLVEAAVSNPECCVCRSCRK